MMGNLYKICGTNLTFTIIFIIAQHYLFVQSANILLISTSDGSRHFTLSALGRALAGNGHNVTQVKSDLFKAEEEEAANKPSPSWSSNSVKVAYYKSSCDYRDMRENYIRTSMRESSMRALIRNGRESMRGLILESIDMLVDRSLQENLNGTKFDLILSDLIVVSSLIYSEEMSIPLVSIGTNLIFPSPHTTGLFQILLPTYPSYVPQIYSNLGDQMKFFERIKNLFFCGFNALVTELMQNPVNQEALQNSSFTPYSNLNKIPRLWIGNVDFSLEFAQSQMPYVISIGGLLTKPANISSLEQKLLNFVESSGEHGIVVVSFGSYVKHMTKETTSQIASALGRLTQKVIWKVADKVQTEDLPANILATHWIPQNDLLGHPKTRVLVTHGGIHSTYEAIYHGVPVVGVPIFYDQFDNLLRLSKMDAGVTLSQGLPTLTAEQLYEAIDQVLSNKRYKENMVGLSSMLRDQPVSPLDRAVFWIENVLQFGTEDVKPQHLFEDLYFFQLYMLDIAAVVIFLILFSIKLARKLVNFISNRIN